LRSLNVALPVDKGRLANADKGKLAGKDAAVAVVAPVTIIYRGKMLGEILAK
jgi:hypothetical protein